MNVLDQINKIRRWDKKWQVLASIEQMADQFVQAWQDMKLIKIPSTYAKIDNIIIMGMGGSGLGGYIIKSFYFNKLSLPFEVVNGYDLPSYASRNSLVIAVSYSGNTEEIVEAFHQALSRRVRLFVVTTNGRLAKMADKEGVPLYHIDDEHNPSARPRLGLCYTLAAELAILKKLELIKFSSKSINNIEEINERYQAKFGLDSPTKKNPAKKIASQLTDKAIMTVASEFLVGNAHTLANLINESANQLANYFTIPELNHHLIDGFDHPKYNRRFLKFLFLESELYGLENQNRFVATKEILTKKHIGFVSYQAKSQSRLGQMFEILLFADYLSFYLAVLNKENPSHDPWIENFKKRLAKMK